MAEKKVVFILLLDIRSLIELTEIGAMLDTLMIVSRER